MLRAGFNNPQEELCAPPRANHAKGDHEYSLSTQTGAPTILANAVSCAKLLRSWSIMGKIMHPILKAERECHAYFNRLG
jgi:hypothetical protein